VELSVDGGKNWRHCFRTLPEKALRHGNKFWTWLFWECEVTVKELANTEQMIVRAFVSHGQLQITQSMSAENWMFF
jgi:nitrate reductase (NAD(P)H)